MEAKKTIVIKLKGGMGNQMFQYAFSRALEQSAKAEGVLIDPLFDVTAFTNPIKKDTPRPYMLPHLNVHANIANDEVITAAKNPYGLISQIVRRIKNYFEVENHIAFVPSLLRPPYKSYYEGYWQSEKYFLPITEQLRREFTLCEPLGEVAKDMYGRINNDTNSVSIFYRRSDYVGHPDFDIGEQDYQQRAIVRMSELLPSPKLYVMSDDIEWVKKNASLPANSVFVSSKDIPPHEEMYLASACRHHIIPNSTFAWWGAWLDPRLDKIVIAPKKWSKRHNDTWYRDITPSDWIRI